MSFRRKVKQEVARIQHTDSELKDSLLDLYSDADKISLDSTSADFIWAEICTQILDRLWLLNHIGRFVPDNVMDMASDVRKQYWLRKNERQPFDEHPEILRSSEGKQAPTPPVP